MKTATFAVAAVAAFTSFSARTLVTAETCSTMTLVFKLLTLLSDAKSCADDTGYTIYPFTGKPTDQQMTAICANPTCTGVLQDAIGNDLPDCTIDFEATKLNLRTELTDYAMRCAVYNSRK
ncbi:elicitin-like protein [Phytophthora cinnamomi]|uniref:elicitin-like protein n=1 Tax=Phytophthora cinnamomi TaxID=4785 RepID=UPI0035596724|nr:elicitin-like protein [Phytophthora cinnamomi]